MKMERRGFVATLLGFLFAPFAARAKATEKRLRFESQPWVKPLVASFDVAQETTHTIPEGMGIWIGGRLFIGPMTVITRKFPDDGTCPAGHRWARNGRFIALAKTEDFDRRGEGVPVSVWESSQNASGVWFKLATQCWVSPARHPTDEEVVCLMRGLCEKLESDFSKYSAVLRDSMVDRLAIPHPIYDCTLKPEAGSL